MWLASVVKKNCGIEKYETKQGIQRVCVCQWRDCAPVCLCFLLCVQPEAFFVLLQRPEALHYEWRGGSPAMQTALTQGKHETQPFNRVHSNVTWLRERWESNASNVSFIHQEAALMLALEPVSHSVLQRCPKLGFLFERRRRKKKRMLVFRLNCAVPVKNVRPASAGCS